MRFVTLIRFTEQGSRSLHETTVRADRFRHEAETSGLKIHQQLWTQGRIDGILIFEAADLETASRAMLKLAGHGFVRTETMPAFDFNEMSKLIQ
ncbi:MAG: GYD domain-containing protein [Pirellulaceae bacterium]|nr:GYD domain-containing protein [Pirellulaceae bacterium]